MFGYFFFLSGAALAGASADGCSAGVSSFFSSISVVISSIGFGGGVVAIVQPIHAPISSMAINAMKTGIRTAYILTVLPTSALIGDPKRLLTGTGIMTMTA